MPNDYIYKKEARERERRSSWVNKADIKLKLPAIYAKSAKTKQAGQLAVKRAGPWCVYLINYKLNMCKTAQNECRSLFSSGG